MTCCFAAQRDSFYVWTSEKEVSATHSVEKDWLSTTQPFRAEDSALETCATYGGSAKNIPLQRSANSDSNGEHLNAIMDVRRNNADDRRNLFWPVITQHVCSQKDFAWNRMRSQGLRLLPNDGENRHQTALVLKIRIQKWHIVDGWGT